MKVAVVSYCSYIPDCPADLEVTSDQIVGIVPMDNEDWGLDVEAIKERYRSERIWLDFDSPDSVGVDEEERPTTAEEFDDWVYGYFSVQELELDTYLRPPMWQFLYDKYKEAT